MNNLLLKAVRAALLTFLPCLLFTLAAHGTVACQQAASKPAATTTSPRQDAGPVVLTVTVTNNRGDYAMGLEKDHFVILDDKAAQDVTYFKGQDEPVSVGILLDVSRSMFDPSMKDLMKTIFNEAILRFIQQGNRANEYFLIGFNERPQLVADWTSNINAINAALAKIGSAAPTGRQTALYDACYLGIEKLAHSKHPRHAILLITDGVDYGSHYTFKELRQLMRESDVLVYAVGISTAIERNSPFGMQAVKNLDELTLGSGGMGFYPEKSFDVRKSFEMIAAELRHQYSIGFRPVSSALDHEWHRIKVKLAIPADAPPQLKHLLVRSREGYYPKAGLR